MILGKMWKFLKIIPRLVKDAWGSPRDFTSQHLETCEHEKGRMRIRPFPVNQSNY